MSLMATVIAPKTRRRKPMAINPHITDPDMRAMLGLPPLGANPLEAFLEQSLDPIARQNINLDQYTQGVKTDPYGIGNQGAINTNLGAANQVLSQLYAANPQAFRGGQFNPYSSFADFNARQNQRAGFNEGSDLGSFVSGGVQHIGDTASELWSEPGFRQLALTAGGGAYAGSQASPGSAVAGGTATPGGALMPAAVPESAATLQSWGLSEVSPGVFAAAAPMGAPASLAPSVASNAPLPAGPAGPAPTTPPVVPPPAAKGLMGMLSSPTALGIGAGALLGGLGGSQQAGTVTVEEGLPDWLMAYAKPALDKYSTQLQNYNTDPYGVMPSAMKEFQNTISGQYLDPSTNKYLEDYFKLGAERIKGALSPSFGHMQAFGQHSGYNEALSRGLGDFSTGLYGGNYAKERDRQTQMTASAPQFLAQSSTAQFAPYQQYLGTIGSLGKKKDQPYFENPFGNIAGGAMLGGTLGSIWK